MEQGKFENKTEDEDIIPIAKGCRIKLENVNKKLRRLKSEIKDLRDKFQEELHNDNDPSKIKDISNTIVEKEDEIWDLEKEIKKIEDKLKELE